MAYGTSAYGSETYGGDISPLIVGLDSADEETQPLGLLHTNGSIIDFAVEMPETREFVRLLGSDIKLEGLDVEVFVVDREGNRLHQLPEINVEELTWNLGVPDTARISGDPKSPQMDQLFLVKVEVQVWIDGKMEWWGVPWRVSGDPGSLVFELEGTDSLGRKRFIDTRTLTFSSKDQRDIAWGLFEHTQDDAVSSHRDLNITKALYQDSSRIRSRMYIREDHSNILTLLQEFPNLEDGFDWKIEHVLEEKFYKDFVIEDNPIVFFRMNEDGIDVAKNEIQESDIEGKYFSSPSFRHSPAIFMDKGFSVEFDGIDDYLQVEPLDGYFGKDDVPYTVECWAMNIDDGTGSTDVGTIVGIGEDDSTPDSRILLSVSQTDGLFEFRHADDDASWVSVTSTTLGEIGKWYHLVATWSPEDTTMRLYVNGVEENTETASSYVANFAHQFLHVCRESNFYGFKHARVDEVAVYDHQLSSDRVQAHYNAGVAEREKIWKRQWTPYYPRKGKFVGNLKIEWKNEGEHRNIGGFSYSEDGLALANEVYVTGGSSGDIRFEGKHTDDAKAEEYGLMQEVVSEGDTLDPHWLSEVARQEVSDRKDPAVLPQIRGVQGVEPGVFQQVEVGDYIPIRIDHGRIQVDNNYRISGKVWRPDNTFELRISQETIETLTQFEDTMFKLHPVGWWSFDESVDTDHFASRTSVPSALAWEYWENNGTLPTTHEEMDAMFDFQGANNTGGRQSGIYRRSVEWNTFTHFTGWKDEAPVPIAAGDSFSWRLFGAIRIPKTGTYTFAFDVDDRADILIDNVLVIGDYSGDQFEGDEDGPGYTENTGEISLSEGWHTFEARMADSGSHSGLALGWKKPGDLEVHTIPVTFFAARHDAILWAEPPTESPGVEEQNASLLNGGEGSSLRMIEENHSYLNTDIVVAEVVGDKPKQEQREFSVSCYVMPDEHDLETEEKVLFTFYDVGSLSFSVLRPNEDVVADNVEDEGRSTSNLFQSIDEETLDDSDYITGDAAPSPEYSGRVGVSGLTGERVLSVRLVAVVFDASGAEFGDVLTPYLNIGGTKYDKGAVSIGIGETTVTREWETNPDTGLPWTDSDIEAFDTSDEFGFSWSSGGNGDDRILQVWMEIDYADTYGLSYVTSDMTWKMVGFGGNKTLSNVHPAGDIYHLAFVVNDDYPKLYVNGSLDGIYDLNLSSESVGSLFASYLFRIGVDVSRGEITTENFWDGLVDEFSIFDYALTEEQIKQLASFRKRINKYVISVLRDNPQIYLRLGEEDGTTALDRAPGSNHPGTYEGSPSLGATSGLITSDDDDPYALVDDGAVDFDGNDDHVVISHHEDLDFDFDDDFSIEFWMQTDFSPDLQLDLDGTSGTHVSTPDSAGLSVVGDLDIRTRVKLGDWSPDVLGVLLQKWPGSSDRSYRFDIQNSGQLRLRSSADGSTISVESTSSTPVGFADDTTHWVRVTLDVDNESNQHVVTFYTSDDDTNDHSVVSWTQLSQQTLEGTTSIFDSSSNVVIGEQITGKMYSSVILDGIDGNVVANPVFVANPWQPEDTSPTARDDAQGNTWTLNGNAEIELIESKEIRIIEKNEDSSHFAYSVRITDAGKLRLYRNDGETESFVESENSLNEGVTHHIVCTRENGKLKVYVDGHFDVEADDESVSVVVSLDVVDSFASQQTHPQGLAWDGTSLWNSDSNSDLIYKLDPSDGTVLDSFSSPGSDPRDLAWDGNNLWLVEGSDKNIYKLDPSDGTVLDSFSSPDDTFPRGLTWDGTNLWHSGIDTDTIYKLDPSDGTVLDSFSSPSSSPHGLAWDGTNLWVIEWLEDVIYKLNPLNGNVVDSFDAPPGNSPRGLTWDGTNLWSCDDSVVDGRRIYKLSFTESTTTNSDDIFVASHEGAEDFFEGILDEIAIYNYALSPGRVFTHYHRGIG